MLDVDDIESHNGGVESDISFGDVATKVIGSVLDLRQMLLHPIKRFE